MKRAVNEEICIYCKKPGSSKEHVAPSSLGGNCTIFCVCKACNSKLSTVDKALGDDSPVALSKVVRTPKTAFSTQIDAPATLYRTDGKAVAVRIENEMKARILPQLILRGKRMEATAESREGFDRLIEHVDKLVKSGRLSKTHKQLDEVYTEPRFVLYRTDASIVQCQSEIDGDTVLRLAEEKWKEIRAQIETAEIEIQTHVNPSILMKLSMDVNGEFRGVAKMAFETLAVMEGSHFVLSEQFDPIRAYILGDVRLPDGVPKDGLAIDQRFVKRADGYSPTMTKEHAVAVVGMGSSLQAFVTFYGNHSYLVELANEGNYALVVRTYEFSTARVGHGEVSAQELGDRLIESHPEQLGLTREQADYILEVLNTHRNGGRVTGAQFAMISSWIRR